MSIDVSPSRLSGLLGMEIKVAMLRRGISGRQLAVRLGESQTWVSTRLTGATPIDVNDLQRIADALELSPVRLLQAVYDRQGVQGMAPYVQTPEQRSTHISPNLSTPHRPDPRSRPPSGSPARPHPAAPATIGVARTALVSRPRRPKAA